LNYKIVGVFTIIFIIAAILGMSKLRFETNFANYLMERNIIKQDIKFVEKNLSGTVPKVYLIKANSRKYDFTHPESLVLLEKIQKGIKNIMKEKYTLSYSMVDYIKEMNRAFNYGNNHSFIIPKNKSEVVEYYELGDSKIIKRFISPDWMEARISFQSSLRSVTEDEKTLFDRVNYFIKSCVGNNYTFGDTGLATLYFDMDYNLRTSKLKSFIVAFFFIFIMMLFVCRNFKLTLISVVPNIFPIIGTLGIMGWFNIPLDVSTMMIASITIGIAVDDTIHFITWFKRNYESGLNLKLSLLNTYTDTGKPIVITSIVLAMGYFVLTTGSILPIIAFGALAGISMLLALVGDLLVLPALILIFKPNLSKSDNHEAVQMR